VEAYVFRGRNALRMSFVEGTLYVCLSWKERFTYVFRGRNALRTSFVEGTLYIV
jgi:hypothetical protein